MVVASTRNSDYVAMERMEYWLEDDLVGLYHDDTKKFITTLLGGQLSLEDIGTLSMIAELNEHENIKKISAYSWSQIRPFPHLTDSHRIAILQDLWFNN